MDLSLKPISNRHKAKKRSPRTNGRTNLHTRNRALPSIHGVSHSLAIPHHARSHPRSSRDVKGKAHPHNRLAHTFSRPHSVTATRPAHVPSRHTHSPPRAAPPASGKRRHRHSPAGILPQHHRHRVRRPLLPSSTKGPGLRARGLPKTHPRARGHRPSSTPQRRPSGAAGAGRV